MIVCNLCGKHNATIYFKGIVNDQAIKLHLCAACAKKNGMVFPFAKSVSAFSDLVADLAGSLKGGAGPLLCRRCGLTYAEFRQTSQLGCGECYATFADLLGPLLKKIHGTAQHVGKGRAATVRLGSRIEQLARLKVELREAVRQEAYEQAAALRDRIQQIERQMTGRPEKDPA